MATIDWTEYHEEEYQALCAVARVAQELVDECRGDLPPSLGTLEKLRKALAADWKIRYER